MKARLNQKKRNDYQNVQDTIRAADNKAFTFPNGIVNLSQSLNSNQGEENIKETSKTNSSSAISQGMAIAAKGTDQGDQSHLQILSMSGVQQYPNQQPL